MVVNCRWAVFTKLTQKTASICSVACEPAVTPQALPTGLSMYHRGGLVGLKRLGISECKVVKQTARWRHEIDPRGNLRTFQTDCSTCSHRFVRVTPRRS